MKFTENAEVEFFDNSGTFSIVGNPTFTENTVSVKFGLVSTPQTFQDLADAVRNANTNDSNLLRIEARGIEFTEDAKPNTEYSMIGEIEGGLVTRATALGHSIDFDLGWNSYESVGGKDSTITNPDDTTIQLTVKYTEVIEKKANVTYEFISEDGSLTLPAAVMDLLPVDYMETVGATVTVDTPDPQMIMVEDGKWVFVK